MDSNFLVGYFIGVFIVLAGLIVTFVFYLLTLQRTLEQVSPKNRQVPPVNVWLMFIPIFNLIYPFILYPKISESLLEEFGDRKLDTSSDFGRNLGMTIAFLGVGEVVMRYLGPLAALASLAALAHLVIWIVYWVKMSQYKEQLINSAALGGVSLSNNPDLLD